MVPEMMRWLWRDHPVSTDVNDIVERAFNERHSVPAGGSGLMGWDLKSSWLEAGIW